MTKISIENVLDKIGIPMNLDGYYYLISAVLLRERNYYSICDLYKEIADIHYSTSSKVERAIRYIKTRYNNQIVKFFNLNCKLTNSILIELLLRKCKRGGKI